MFCNVGQIYRRKNKTIKSPNNRAVASQPTTMYDFIAWWFQDENLLRFRSALLRMRIINTHRQMHWPLWVNWPTNELRLWHQNNSIRSRMNWTVDCGFRCYIHKENGTVISIPDELKHPGMDMEAWEEDMENRQTCALSVKMVWL